MAEEQEPDYGAPDEEFEWPEVGTLRAADAARLLYGIESQATAANSRADRLKRRKALAQTIMRQVLDREELESARAKMRDGKVVQYTPYERDVFTIDNPDEFKAWAEENSDENFYDMSPKLREGIFMDEMRRRHSDGEALPPGVRRVPLPQLSRNAVAAKRESR